MVGPADQRGPQRPRRGSGRPRRRTAPARPAPAPSSSARRRPCRSSPGATTRRRAGEVAVTSAAEQPGPPADEARDAQVDARRCPARRAGRRARASPTRRGSTAPSSPDAAAASPNARCIDRLMIQNDSTGFDQKWSASMRRARPPQADVVAAHRHLAGHLAVVGLPGILQPVRTGEGDVEQQADQDDEQADFSLAEAVQGHGGDGRRCYAAGRCCAIATPIYAGRGYRRHLDGVAARVKPVADGPVI